MNKKIVKLKRRITFTLAVNAIKERMYELGLTQKELSLNTGVPETFINLLLYKTRVVEYIDKIFDFLGYKISLTKLNVKVFHITVNKESKYAKISKVIKPKFTVYYNFKNDKMYHFRPKNWSAAKKKFAIKEAYEQIDNYDTNKLWN